MPLDRMQEYIYKNSKQRRMYRTYYFERGMELYKSKRYKEAAEHFLLGIAKLHSAGSKVWLGRCYESGLGVEKNLLMAKDLYRVAYNNFGHSQRNSTTGVWVQERLVQLKHIPNNDSMSMSIDGIGNVKAIKTLNGPQAPQLRYNMNETVVTCDTKETFVEMFHYAQETIPRLNREWTCDGLNRFFDGYTLNTHHFSLLVTRGESDSYLTRLNGHCCHVLFPKNANLNYIYVQESILKKVKEIIYKRAQEVIPQVLQKVSERINVPYSKCTVVKTLRNYSAFYYPATRDVTFCARCIQLPRASLEALCIHELTHSFVNGHDKNFHEKMQELGGHEMHELDKNLWKEDLWPYLNI